MNRAYSVINLKAIDAEGRILEGIASTPSPDRMQDVLVVDGMVFKTPFPFLYHHDAKKPIGRVVSARKTSAGLMIRAELAADDVAPWIPEARKLIGAGLIRGFSIGFRPTKDPEFIKGTGGLRYTNTEIFEVSAVTIPANAEATILSVKSADALMLTAFGLKHEGAVQLTNPPGVSGTTTPPLKKENSMTTQEAIAQYEAKFAANQARMQSMVAKSVEEGRTFEDAESAEHDGLETENEKITKHIAVLKRSESVQIATATVVTPANTGTPEAAAQARQGASTISVKSMAPKGIGMARVAIAVIKANGDHYRAAELAKKYWPDSPEVELNIKSVIEAGDTTTSGWASQLVPAAAQMQNEFLDLLRPQTILGKIQGLRRVPFNVAVPIQSGGGTYGWVGEAKAKPVSKLTLTSQTLRWSKAAGIIVITEELARFSSPSAELLIRNDMMKGLVTFFDTQFIDPAVAAVSNVSPASITNGANATVATGATATKFRYDMNTMLGLFITDNQDPTSAVVLMSAGQAMALSLMTNALGQPEFPSISVNGGTIMGLPVIVSASVGARIVLVNASDILLAEDNGIRIDVSNQATIEMDTEPVQGDTSPFSAATTVKSFWQNNLIGLRAEQYITWVRARTSSVQYLSSTAYAPPSA